nr:hypothetical protein [Ferrimicrobium acidiphilum]
MQNPNSHDPGYPATLLTPTRIPTVQPTSLIHVNPEASGTEGFDDTTMSFQSGAMITEESPAYYRYTLAAARSVERLRLVGLVVGLLCSELRAPLWIAVDTPDLDAMLTSQGGYLGNLADSSGVVHRLERYEGPALEAVVSDMLTNQPAVTIMERNAQTTPVIVPVFITSFEAALTCIRAGTTNLANHEDTARAWQWLTAIADSSNVLDDSSVSYTLGNEEIAVQTQSTTVIRGDQRRSPSPQEQPTSITWNPHLPLLRQIAETNDPTLHIPATLALHPATSVLNGVADHHDLTP